MAKMKPAASIGITTQADCLIHCNWLFNYWKYFTVLASFKLQSKASCLIIGILLYTDFILTFCEWLSNETIYKLFPIPRMKQKKEAIICLLETHLFLPKSSIYVSMVTEGNIIHQLVLFTTYQQQIQKKFQQKYKKKSGTLKVFHFCSLFCLVFWSNCSRGAISLVMKIISSSRAWPHLSVLVVRPCA